MIVLTRNTNQGLFKVKKLDDGKFRINFYSNCFRGCHAGRKLFSSLEETEAYINMLLVTGFHLFDL